MNNQCAVIRDLMPLYAESMTSEASVAMVEEHLAGCSSCRAFLAEIRQTDSRAMDTDISALHRVKQHLQRKKRLTVLVTLMLTLIVMIIAIAYVTAPDDLPYNHEIVSIEELEDGRVMVVFDASVAGYDLSFVTNEQDNSREYSLTAWNTTWNRWFPRHGSDQITWLNPAGEKVTAVYYYQTNGEPDRLIYQRGAMASDGRFTLPRLVLNVYFILMVGFLVISGIAWLIFRHKPAIANVLSKITFLPIAYIAGHFIVTGFNATTYHASRDFLAILLVMIPFYIVLIAVEKLVKARKKQTS